MYPQGSWDLYARGVELSERIIKKGVCFTMEIGNREWRLNQALKKWNLKDVWAFDKKFCNIIIDL